MTTSAYICTANVPRNTTSECIFYVLIRSIYSRRFPLRTLLVGCRDFCKLGRPAASLIHITTNSFQQCKSPNEFAGARSTVTHKQRPPAKRAENTVLTSPRSSSKRMRKTRPTTTSCRVACSKILGRILKRWNSVSLMHIRESLSVSLLSDFHSFMSNRRWGISLPALTTICHG